MRDVQRARCSSHPRNVTPPKGIILIETKARRPQVRWRPLAQTWFLHATWFLHTAWFLHLVLHLLFYVFIWMCILYGHEDVADVEETNAPSSKPNKKKVRPIRTSRLRGWYTGTYANLILFPRTSSNQRQRTYRAIQKIKGIRGQRKEVWAWWLYTKLLLSFYP
jgi:hypothetical protein